LFLFYLVHICTPKLPHLAFSISLLTSVLSLFITHASCINKLMDQINSIHFNPIQFNSIQFNLFPFNCIHFSPIHRNELDEIQFISFRFNPLQPNEFNFVHFVSFKSSITQWIEFLNLMNLIQLSHFSHCWLFFFTFMELWDPMQPFVLCVKFQAHFNWKSPIKDNLYNKESNVTLLWRIWQEQVEMSLNPFSQVLKFCISLICKYILYIVVVVLLHLLLVIIVIILFCLLSLLSYFNFYYCFICKGMTFQLMEPSCSLKNVVQMPHALMDFFSILFSLFGVYDKIEITNKKYILQITLMPILEFITCICDFFLNT
jgi:hypothetical protein